MHIRLFCTFNYKSEFSNNFSTRNLVTLNAIKVSTLIPVIGTVVGAIILYTAYKANNPPPEFIARACFALIPGVGTAILLPLDVIGTLVKLCVDAIRKTPGAAIPVGPVAALIDPSPPGE